MTPWTYNGKPLEILKKRYRTDGDGEQTTISIKSGRNPGNSAGGSEVGASREERHGMKGRLRRPKVRRTHRRPTRTRDRARVHNMSGDLKQMSNIFFAPARQAPWVLELDRGAYPERSILEISSRSTETIGRQLSAMQLTVEGPDGGRSRVEVAYQEAKDYGEGPAVEGNPMDGFAAKRADKARRQGELLIGFTRDDLFWPASGGTTFYDWLWIQAALQLGPHSVTELLSDWTGFSDMFHHGAGTNGKPLACQAKSAAILRALDMAEKTFPADDAAAWCRLCGCAAQDYPVPI